MNYVLSTTNKRIFDDIRILSKYIDTTEIFKRACSISNQTAPMMLSTYAVEYVINLNIDIDPKYINFLTLQNVVLINVAE